MAADLALAVGWAGLASADLPLWRESVSAWGYVRLYTPRYVAAADLADGTEGGLVVTELCIDPLIFKVNWGGPVADFHPGLAWPARVDAIGAVASARLNGIVDLVAASEADVRWLITSTACDPGMSVPAGSELVASRAYAVDGWEPAGTVQLWRLPG